MHLRRRRMPMLCALLLFILVSDFGSALPTGTVILQAPRVGKGWADPRTHGGRFLDYATRRYGEPLNIIISAHSDPYVLTDSGLHAYAKSIGFSDDCLGIHLGTRHYANLGDGAGRQTQRYLARQFYFPGPQWGGTCWESLAGGNHFRAWKQRGSGAWFIGASKEENAGKHHKIVPDGYNLGRDWLVDRAVSGSRWGGNWWMAEVEWKTGLLPPGSHGVNHNISQDGHVAILTIHRLTNELNANVPPDYLFIILCSLLLTTFMTGFYYLFTSYILYPFTRVVRQRLSYREV